MSETVMENASVVEGTVEPELTDDVEGTAESTPKKRRGRQKRPVHPIVQAAIEAKTLLTAIPEGYSLAKHAPIEQELFEQEYLWIEFRGQSFIERGEALVKKAGYIKQFGSKENQAAASKMMSHAVELAKLKEQLTSSGVDAEAMLRQLLAGATEG